jgi:ribosomal protein L24
MVQQYGEDIWDDEPRKREDVKRRKSKLARKGAIQTRIIDEEEQIALNNVIRTAVKEKQVKTKKSKTEATTGNTTEVDKTPILKKEPIDQVRF